MVNDMSQWEAVQPVETRDSWRTTNVVLTVVGAVVLVLAWAALVLWVLAALMGSTICGMSCDAAQVIMGRVLWAAGIGALLSLVPVVVSFVQRRWSSLWLGLAILVVVAAFVVSYAVGSVPLSSV
ncbi:hypothetical protein [Gordonia crocea]|uniref:Uncharacterized protein n=1 Tax=Gordonia crocea TaxID=589162 RepID=A0A7I9UZS3_9ACTN|nr:hypothetical protein [Gordonia crocea]GED98677.1 hypothetical protein nbrc107697_27160 [Gordonia crocea]